MTQTSYIQITTYCQQTSIDTDFVITLEKYGLIKTKTMETQLFIAEDDITEIERMFRLHKELGVNLEGIDVINNLVKRLKTVESELNSLKKVLALYE